MSDPVSASLEPRTEAGKALFGRLWAVNDYATVSRIIATVAHDVALIEEQAATEARRELLAKVEAFIVSHDKAWHHPNVSYCDGHCEPLRAMRRLIEESR